MTDQMPDYDAPIDPHEPDGPGLGDDRYRPGFGSSPFVRHIELPGETFHGTITEALGIVWTDEDRAEFAEAMAAVDEVENVDHGLLSEIRIR